MIFCFVFISILTNQKRKKTVEMKQRDSENRKLTESNEIHIEIETEI